VQASSIAQCGDWVCVGEEDGGGVAPLQLIRRCFASDGQLMKTSRVKSAITAVTFGPLPSVIVAGTSDGILLKWIKTAGV